MRCLHELNFENKKSLSNHKRWCEGRMKPAKTGINEGPLNGMWKGNGVSYSGLHAWLRKYIKKPSACQHCFKKPAEEIANVSKEYKRDFTDWIYLCRSCHNIFDKRILNITRMRQYYE